MNSDLGMGSYLVGSTPKAEPDAEAISLPEHEKASQRRYDHLLHKLKKLKKEIKMADSDVNVYAKDPMSGIMPLMMGNGFGGGTGAAVGGGLGAGLLGGILGGVLLNRNGVLGGGVDATAGVVTPAMLTSAINGVTDNNNVTTILQSLGDIKGAIPLAEGQVQLALAGAQSDLTNLINTGNVALMQGQFAINKNVSDTTAQIIAAQNATQDVVQNGNAAIQASLTNIATGIVQNAYAVTTAVRDDGDKTRALIVAQNDASLNRQLATAEAALLEQRAIGRSAATEVNVSQVVNQVQAQAQAQTQQQQQLILLSQIAAGFQGLQNAVATNSNLIVGNTGAVATGPQTANPVNVRA